MVEMKKQQAWKLSIRMWSLQWNLLNTRLDCVDWIYDNYP